MLHTAVFKDRVNPAFGERFNINMCDSGITSGCFFFRPAGDFDTLIAKFGGGVDDLLKRRGIKDGTDKSKFHNKLLSALMFYCLRKICANIL